MSRSSNSSCRSFKMIDLFAGTGACSHVFEESGVECVFANDFAEESEKIFNKNHSLKLTLCDIADVNESKIPKHDILCAGFPCQPFSISGKKKGFEDKRSNCFWDIIRIAKYHSPKVMILENVKNLKSHDKGNTFKTIISSLEEIGYLIKHDILNTCEITNIPQHRERIYMVCFKDPKLFEKFSFDFEKVDHDEIIDFLESEVNKKYYYTDKYKVYSEIQKAVVSHIDTGIVYQYRRYYVRDNKSGVCPTLTANMGEGGHNVPLILDDNGIRKLTPRECFNLQGFEDYKLPKISDSKLYKLAGNAVSVPVVRLIVNALLKIL